MVQDTNDATAILTVSMKPDTDCSTCSTEVSLSWYFLIASHHISAPCSFAKSKMPQSRCPPREITQPPELSQTSEPIVEERVEESRMVALSWILTFAEPRLLLSRTSRAAARSPSRILTCPLA